MLVYIYVLQRVIMKVIGDIVTSVSLSCQLKKKTVFSWALLTEISVMTEF